MTSQEHPSTLQIGLNKLVSQKSLMDFHKCKTSIGLRKRISNTQNRETSKKGCKCACSNTWYSSEYCKALPKLLNLHMIASLHGAWYCWCSGKYKLNNDSLKWTSMLEGYIQQQLNLHIQVAPKQSRWQLYARHQYNIIHLFQCQNTWLGKRADNGETNLSSSQKHHHQCIWSNYSLLLLWQTHEWHPFSWKPGITDH